MDETYDVSQSKLIEKMNLYIDKYNQSNTPALEKLDPVGVCSGLVGLFMCNSDDLYNQLKILARLPYTDELFAQTFHDIYKDLLCYQSPDKQWLTVKQYEVDIISEKLNKAKFKHEFSFTFMLKQDELDTIIQTLNKNGPLNNTYLRIDSHNHSIVVHCKDNTYHLYDPNRKNFHEIKTDKIDILSFYIKSSFQKNYSDVPTPIFIDIYSNTKNKSEPYDYPDKKDLIKDIFNKRGDQWKKYLTTGMDNVTVLHLPARRGDAETIRIIFEEVKVRSSESLLFLLNKNAKGSTPIHEAASHGHFNVVQLFVNEGLHVTTTNKDGRTPLHLAAIYSHYDDSQKLIELLAKNTPINSLSNNNETAMHVAETVEGCKILISNGADIDLQDKKGYTPIHRAIEYGDVEIVKLLLEHRANLSLSATIDYQKFTPLEFAEKLAKENPKDDKFNQICQELRTALSNKYTL